MISPVTAALPTLSFRYDVSRQTYLDVQRAILRRSRFYTIAQYGYGVVPALVVAMSLLAGHPLRSLGPSLPYLVLIPLIGYVLLPLLNKWMTEKTLRANPSFAGAHEVALTSEGISMTSPAATALIRWTAFLRIVEGREYFLFYILTNRAHFLPISAIPHDDLPAVRAFIASHATSPTELAA